MWESGCFILMQKSTSSPSYTVAEIVWSQKAPEGGLVGISESKLAKGSYTYKRHMG